MNSAQKQELLKQLASFEEVIQGTITQRRHQCGKPTCRCKSNPDFLHSSFQLSFAVDGKTKTITIPKDKVLQAKNGLSQYMEMRKVLQQLIDYNRNQLKRNH